MSEDNVSNFVEGQTFVGTPEGLTEVKESTTETKKELTPEEQQIELRKVSEMRHKALSNLVTLHIQNYGKTLIATNKVSYQQKLNALDSLVRAFNFAMDFGIGVTKAKMQDGGALGKQENELAGLLVQALDNRMLLVADNMQKQEIENAKNAETKPSEGEQVNG